MFSIPSYIFIIIMPNLSHFGSMWIYYGLTFVHLPNSGQLAKLACCNKYVCLCVCGSCIYMLYMFIWLSVHTFTNSYCCLTCVRANNLVIAFMHLLANIIYINTTPIWITLFDLSTHHHHPHCIIFLSGMYINW